MFKKRKWSAIVATVSDKNKRSFFNRCVLRFDEQSWRSAGSDLRGGDEVTQRTEIAFESGAGLFDDLGIESDAGELDKMLSVCARKIDKACMSFLNDIPTRLEIVQGQTELGRENIDRADRQQAEHGGTAGKAIYHFIDCAVAARALNDRQRRKFPPEHELARCAQPIFQHGRVDVAEIDVEAQVAVIEIR